MGQAEIMRRLRGWPRRCKYRVLEKSVGHLALLCVRLAVYVWGREGDLVGAVPLSEFLRNRPRRCARLVHAAAVEIAVWIRVSAE